MIRLPAVAGRFYSASENGLREEIARAVPDQRTPTRAVAAIVPHAGLMYSGRVAGAVYADLLLPPTVILIGPNHTGKGPPISIFPEGRWAIPGAEVTVDRECTVELLRRFPSAQADTSAHQFEHCLELQLPFLVYGTPRAAQMPHGVKIVAVVLGTTDPDVCRRFGAALADVITASAGDRGPGTMLIASTDMNHYESEERTRHKDSFAIEAIESLASDALLHRTQADQISMCGLGAVLTVLAAARSLGAIEASLKRYATSADAGGDRERVVGYAGFVIADAKRSVV
jgi:AmmeMemoRadiSam system protein B